jgi:Fe-S cluster biogenesis protein NfuA
MNPESKPTHMLYPRVLAALDKIRPYLEADGGDVKILEISDENVVTIELLGACGTCPMSTMTMKAGVEEAVKREVPEIKSVQAVNITPHEYL